MEFKFGVEYRIFYFALFQSYQIFVKFWNYFLCFSRTFTFIKLLLNVSTRLERRKSVLKLRLPKLCIFSRILGLSNRIQINLICVDAPILTFKNNLTVRINFSKSIAELNFKRWHFYCISFLYPFLYNGVLFETHESVATNFNSYSKIQLY